MQIVLIGLGFLALSGASFVAVMYLARRMFRALDEHNVVNRARSVEREATQREVNMRRYSMRDLKPVKSQHER